MDAAPPDDPPPIVAPVAVASRWGEVAFQALAGGRRLSVAAFDAPLRASGYGPLPRDYAGGGFALDASFARWRFELAFLYTVASASSLVDGSSVGAAVGDVGLYGGYDVLRWQGLTGFVMGGLGYSALMLDARDPHWSWIATQTQVTSDVGTVEQDAFMLGAQAGLEQIIPLDRAGPRGAWGLTLSLRAGFERQMADVGWMTTGDSKPLGGLPGVDLGGPWVALGIGVGALGPFGPPARDVP